MLKIEARKWVAVWYRCPSCGAQTGYPMLTPYQWAHRRADRCYNFKCHNAVYEVVGHKWYTTFAIEPGLTVTTIAGTLEKFGPFRICDIVQPNIRAFRRWYRRRCAERDEQVRQYREHERQIKAEWADRRAQQRQAVGVASSDQADDFDPFFDEG